MKLIKCENEHYYDSDKFDDCPHCANMIAGGRLNDILGENQKKIDTAIPNHDILKDYEKISHQRVTGWLVCIKGEMQGECFTLYEGTNRIGRASHMDVALFREPTVSRENHAVITYHSDTNLFSLSIEPDGVAPVSYNNTLVKKNLSQTISIHDILTLGDCQLCFIPFCDEYFNWSDSIDKQI